MPSLSSPVASSLKIKTGLSSPLEESKMSPTAAEKRRNKLGYHRTSVACGHCRRRKIRCLLASADPHGRCSNCIRLKKECNFYPVDQQPPAENQPRSVSKGDSHSQGTSGSSAAPSPPSMMSGLGSNEESDMSQYPQLPLTSNHEYMGYGQGFKDSAPSPLTPVPTSSMDYQGKGAYDQSQMWNNGIFMEDSPFSNHTKTSPEDPSSYWHLESSPMTANYPNSQYGFVPNARSQMPRDAMGSVISFAGTQSEVPWAVPATRSLSVANVEDIRFAEQQQPNYANSQRRMTSTSDMYTPSLQHSSTSSNASVSESQPGSMSAFSTHAINSPAFAQWNLYNSSQPNMIGKGHDTATNGWGVESMPHLGQLPEEESQYPDHFQHYSGINALH